MSNISIIFKPEIKPLGPSQLESLKPYRVVSAKDNFDEAEVGDIVLRFPSYSGGHFILNATKQKMFFDRSSSSDWSDSFKCLRAFDVQTIQFTYDVEDRP